MSERDPTTTTTAPDRDDRAHWDERYRSRYAEAPGGDLSLPDPPDGLMRLSSLLPIHGRAIDVAGGDGGGGLFMARRGLDATVADVSEVALARARDVADQAELVLETAAIDVASMGLREVLTAIGGPAPAVVTCWSYLSRPLLGTIGSDLPSGCRFLTAIATTTNLERSARPPARFLLQPGELVELVVGSAPARLRVLHRREGWAADRHRAELVVEAR